MAHFVVHTCNLLVTTLTLIVGKRFCDDLVLKCVQRMLGLENYCVKWYDTVEVQSNTEVLFIISWYLSGYYSYLI